LTYSISAEADIAGQEKKRMRLMSHAPIAFSVMQVLARSSNEVSERPESIQDRSLEKDKKFKRKDDVLVQVEQYTDHYSKNVYVNVVPSIRENKGVEQAKERALIPDFF
jgi:hypothetical protein